MKRAAVLGVLLLFSVSMAHGLPQREGLALELVAKYRKAFPDPLRTVSHSFSLVSYDDQGRETSAWRGRLIADFENRRAAIESYEKGELAERVVLIGKKAYRIDFERGETEEVSSGEGAQYGLLFKQAAQGFFAVDYSRLAYERDVAYGQLVRGQQVSAAPAITSSSEPLISLGLVFDDAGSLVATVREIALSGKPQFQVMVLGAPAEPSDLRQLVSGTLYSFDPATGRSVRLAERKTEELVFNESVDESLFQIGEKVH